MRNKICLILVLILFISYNSWSQSNGVVQYDSTTEALEWSATGVLGAGALYLGFDKTAWFSEPHIKDGRTDLTFEKDTVPEWSISLVGVGMLSGIIFMPNNNGTFNHTAYTNSKGFSQALALTLLTTGIAKHAVGRKRPDYDDRVARGEDVEDGRFSFWSGHASVSFSLATYFSLFILEHVGDWDNEYHVMGKVLVSAVLIGGAALVSASRVSDNKHHTSDVIVGGAVGMSISFLFYALQNEWFFERYDRVQDSGDANNFSLLVTNESVAVNYHF